jgi:hypothetical protein
MQGAKRCNGDSKVGNSAVETQILAVNPQNSAPLLRNTSFGFLTLKDGTRKFDPKRR